MTLASLLLLWSLTVTGSSAQQLWHDNPDDTGRGGAIAAPARLTPLQDNGWSAQRASIDG